MRTLEFQAEFKDNFFINKLTLTHTSLSLPNKEIKNTFSRSMWTNKIKRTKIIVLKNASNDKIFRNAFFEEKNEQS